MEIYDIINSINFKENSTVVFDIDETLLSNSGKPINITINIYNYLLSKGIKPYIVTARINSKYVIDLTQRQLANAGIRNYKGIYFRPYYMNTRKFKEKSRENITEELNEVIEMTFGDMDWDYTGKYSGRGIKVGKL